MGRRWHWPLKITYSMTRFISHLTRSSLIFHVLCMRRPTRYSTITSLLILTHEFSHRFPLEPCLSRICQVIVGSQSSSRFRPSINTSTPIREPHEWIWILISVLQRLPLELWTSQQKRQIFCLAVDIISAVSSR